MFRIIAVTVALVLGGIAAGFADEVQLVNGDKLTGKIDKMVDGKLTLKTIAAGDVLLEVDAIATFSTDDSVEIRLKDGTVIKERVGTAEPGKFALVSVRTLQAQTLAVTDIRSINQPIKWIGAVSAGVTIATGNSETQNVSLGVSLLRRSEMDRITFNGGYFYGRQRDRDSGDHITSQNEWFAGLQYDYFFTPKLYVYANTRVERDEIANLDLRLLAGLGGGYQLFETADFRFAVEGGGGWSYEVYDNAGSSDHAFIRCAYHIAKKFGTRLALFHDLEIFPSVEDFSDFFLTTQGGLRASLTKAMFAEMKIVVDHDSTPAPGSKNTDVKYIFGAGITF